MKALCKCNSFYTYVGFGDWSLMPGLDLALFTNGVKFGKWLNLSASLFFFFFHLQNMEMVILYLIDLISGVSDVMHASGAWHVVSAR